MHKLVIAIGAASLFALPALAQTSGTSNPAQASQPQATHPMSQGDLQQMRQKITHDLQSDGYKNVQVIPDSFLVHATDKRGEPVVMIINPNSVFEMTQLPATAGNGNGPNGTSSNHNGLGNSPNGTSRQ